MIAATIVVAALLQSAPPEKLVLVQTLIPDLVEDLRYKTADNFLKEKVYPDSARCLLRESVAKRLAKAAQALRTKGLRLKVFDCYRPRSVQWKMWKILPRPGYVADPRKGSNHNRGAAVDLTLVDAQDRELEMPTGFDSFEKAAHHGYPGGSEASRRNRELLREAMEAAGFRKNKMEWWHYDATDHKKHAVLDQPFESLSPPPR